MAREAEGDVAVPATLRALLAARLDQLDPDERSVLERGAVEGEIFHRGAVQALSPDGQVTPRLAALVRKGLIRPDKAQLPGEEAFRFHHLLLRDAAYERCPRASVPTCTTVSPAGSSSTAPSSSSWTSCSATTSSRPPATSTSSGRTTASLALAAGDRLGAAGRRAFWRGDWRSGGRAARACSLAHASVPARSPSGGRARACALLDRPCAAGRGRRAVPPSERRQRKTRPTQRSRTRSPRLARMNYRQGSPDEVERLAREALPLLEAKEDDEGLATSGIALAWVANMRQRYEDWAQGEETGMRHAPPRRPSGSQRDWAGRGADVRAAARRGGAGDARRGSRRPSASRRHPDASPAARDARPGRRGLGGRSARGGAPP